MSPKKNSNIVQEEEIEIRPNHYVKIMSLVPYILNLKRTNGIDPLTFNSFGEIQRVTYAMLVDMMSMKRFEPFLKNGYFTILDEKVVRNLGLDDALDKILKKEEIEMVFDNSCPTESALELFKTANDRQKTIIADMLISRVRDGKPINMNLVHAIERESKIKIIERAEAAKEAMELGVP